MDLIAPLFAAFALFIMGIIFGITIMASRARDLEKRKLSKAEPKRIGVVFQKPNGSRVGLESLIIAELINHGFICVDVSREAALAAFRSALLFGDELRGIDCLMVGTVIDRTEERSQTKFVHTEEFYEWINSNRRHRLKDGVYKTDEHTNVDESDYVSFTKKHPREKKAVLDTYAQVDYRVLAREGIVVAGNCLIWSSSPDRDQRRMNDVVKEIMDRTVRPIKKLASVPMMLEKSEFVISEGYAEVSDVRHLSPGSWVQPD